MALPPHERAANGVWDLLAWDDGAGPALYASGRFEQPVGTGGVARLRAGAWEVLAGSPMSSGYSAHPLGLIEVDGRLALGAGATGVIGAWVDGQWRDLGPLESWARAMLRVEDASGARTYLGGTLTSIGGTSVRNVAAWDGGSWSALTEPGGVSGGIGALESSPPRLYAGGSFLAAGGVAAARAAMYEGGVWSALGGGFTGGTYCHGAEPYILSLLDVSLPEVTGLVAGGSIAGPGFAIARWDGAAWRTMADGLELLGCADCCPHVADLAVFDDGTGPALYATGLFNHPARGVARWSGAEWLDVGGGLAGFLYGAGEALVAHDDGSGIALYVGGWFESAGGTPAANIARWDGDVWAPVGAGLPTPVNALATFEGALFAAGGSYSSAGEVWRWDGAVWSRIGATFDRGVSVLAVFDDGSGPALYAGGGFSAYDGQAIGGLAVWDGSAWVRAAGGVDGSVYALEPEAHEGKMSLLVGGRFSTVGAGVSSQNLARLVGCVSACYADCDDSGALDFFDFLCFQNEFAQLTSYADCDHSGSHDFFDFLCFQNAFAAGCP